jgi:glutathione synthase
MKALFIIDPLDGLKPYKDTSIDLMVEARERGHEVFWCGAEDVSAGSQGVSAFARTLELDASIREHKTMATATYESAAPADTPLEGFGAIFIRPDPPFDQRYLSLALLLDPLKDSVQFVNRPDALRLVSEKLSALNFPQAIPQSLISYRSAALKAFAGGFDKVVLKPCYLASGNGIVVSSAGDPDFDTHVANILAAEPKGPVIAQEFLPEVSEGDTRVMVIDGAVVGAVGRKPAEGEFRANIAAGGSSIAATLTEGQRAAAVEVGAMLKAQGVLFAGLDFIGDKLIEINVTSPTLVQELRRLGGPDVSKRIWDLIEERA